MIVECGCVIVECVCECLDNYGQLYCIRVKCHIVFFHTQDGAVIDKFTLIKDKHTSYGLNPNPVKPVADPPKMWAHFHQYDNEYRNNIKNMKIKT